MTDRTYTIALAGNPNVGKSTVFNALTHLHQHTGNWPGKTVATARGCFTYRRETYTLVDLPGTYSLFAESPEEEIARDFICSGEADATLVVADATCLERNLNLVLQVMACTHPVVLCVNLLDEARKKGIEVDLTALQDALGIPVVGTAVRGGEGLDSLLSTLRQAVHRPLPPPRPQVAYPDVTDLPPDQRQDALAAALMARAAELAALAVHRPDRADRRDRRLDRLLTSKATGIPVMLLLLGLVFWLTIAGANVPSELLSSALIGLQEPLRSLLGFLPPAVQSALVDGVYRTVAWVVSVMLPPMAIFFPLFTLLEDAGYLPRVAFNLDHAFRKAGAHGRQSLTMCMGLGCNACGVMGCRIIDSPRERLIAILTNSFVPCNGRFPTLIALLTMFFVTGSGLAGSLASAALLLAAIVLAVAMTLAASKLLSCTVLRGTPSAFSLELPPYRMPQIGRTLIRSILDRTVFVLGRAVLVAAPAGLLIWLLGNLTVGGTPLLTACARFLEPVGALMGLDGMILLAFVLGFPANEIVIPILLMGYLSTGTLTAYTGLAELKLLLVQNGWTWETALCATVFTLFHFPCGTTSATIYRETGSVKWTALAVALPTLTGFLLCTAVHLSVCLWQ